MYTLKKALYDRLYGVAKPRAKMWIPIAALSLFLGFQHGKANSETLDMKDIIEFKGQDEQIYRLLEQKPVMSVFYFPGDPRFEIFRGQVIRASNKFKCGFYYDQLNIDFPKLPHSTLTLPLHFPQSQLTKFKFEGQYPQVAYDKDFTLEGIEYFLREQGILESVDYTRKLKNKIPKLN